MRKAVLVDPKTASAMASDRDAADAAITTLCRKCEDITRIFDRGSVGDAVDYSLNHIQRFDHEFSCLKIFLDCIHKWTDLEDVLHLGSLVSKVEATIQKIVKKLIRKNAKLLLKRSEILGFPIFIIPRKVEDQYLKRNVSKLNDLCSDLMNEVTDLKMEIREAYGSFSLATHSFDFRFDPDWGNFGKFVDKYCQACRGQARFGWCTLDEERELSILNDHLLRSKDFLDQVASGSFSDLKAADAMIHVGKVAISAALRLCEWWAVEEMHRVNVRIALLELRQKIDLANPEFVDLNLELLKEDRYGLQCLVDAFFKSYMFHFSSKKPGGYHFSSAESSLSNYFPHLVDTFEQELKLLLIAVQRGDAMNVQRYLADVKAVLTKVTKLFKSNYNFEQVENIVHKLLQEIWVIKTEIFLREQLLASPIFQMPKNEGVMFLAMELSDRNYDRWLDSLNAQIQYSQEGNIKKVEQISTLTEEIGKVVARLRNSIDAEEIIIEEGMVRNELLRLLSMIVLFKADSLFINFLNNNNNQRVMVLDEDQVEAFHKGLDFLTMFVKDQSAATVDEAKLVFEQIEEVACVVASLFHSLTTNEIREVAIEKMKILISDVLEKITHIIAEVKNIYLLASRINFPKTNGMGFIDSLLEKLGELQKADLKVSLKHQIEGILKNLKILTPFLRDILEQDIQTQELRDFGARIINLAYEAEHFIDWTMLEGTVNWQNSLRLYHVLEDLRFLKSSVKTQHDKAPIQPQTSVQKDPKATASTIGDIVVVLNDQEKKIIDQLIRGTEKLEIVPIVGMPGIGKTTLARRVYNNQSVATHFHIRTWCCVSQIYRKREVLLEILSHIMPLTDESHGMTDEDLENELRKLSLQNRYLVVLDDMWNIKALDDLGNSLLNQENGSRILVTSRNHHVASKANPHADPHFLRQLSDAESWNLLQMKIFHKEEVPKGLRVIGEQIARSCKGLPLAIVAVAGLLQKIERQYSSWKEIAEDLSFHIVDDPNEHCRRILELSYKYLPDYLQACFLYFGAFLEDQDIPARKLLQLWIAEGFIQQSESKSLEDVAEDYLMDLIDRSLVLFSQRKSRGGVKACRVHDVLRKLCLTKAKDDKFLRVIMGQSDESNASLYDLGYVISANSSRRSSVTYEDYRLCYCSKRDHFIQSRPSGQHVRSLLCFASGDKDPKCPYDISFVSQDFRLLKVLDLECINMGTSFPSGIELLVLLRYLAVAGYIDSVPSSIGNLWSLETLVVRGLKGKVNLPNSIWRLKKLRHLHVTDIAVISLQNEQQGSSEGLDYLVTLSSPFLPFGEDTDNMLSQFLNLQKLKCVFSESWDNSRECNLYPSLGVLIKLESLKISYYGQALHPGEFSFPLNLKKLTLSNFRLPWNKISVIGQLPNLEVLKLLRRAFDGESWDMVEGEFSQLKYLKLDTLNIVNWNAYSDHLPKLQHLVLRCCKQLKKVPSSFGEIPTLEMINVQWCGDGVEKSVKQIREEGDGILKVFINFAAKD